MATSESKRRNRWHLVYPLSLLLSAATFCLGTLAFVSLDTRNIASAADLREIQQRGKLIVAVKDNLRPLGFRDGEGNLQGLEIDIAKRLAAEMLGRSDAVVLQPVANNDRLSVLLQGKVDLTIARVTQTPSRDRIVSFSIPYYLDGTSLVTKDASVQKLEDVSRVKIAVLKGSSTIAIVRYFIPNAQLVGVDSYQQARSLLESGGAGAFAADNSVLAGWVHEYSQYRLLPVRLSGEALCVVMPKGVQYTGLSQQVDSAIARWKAEGWLQERIKYWGLP